MQLGFSLPNRGVLFGATTVDEMLRLAQLVDGTGAFDSVWVGDGLIAKPRLEAIATLSAIAATTERLRLGVCCMATFPLRNPVLFACQWASLDVLSGGRSLLAVCLGAPTDRGGGDFAAELQAMNVVGKERVGRLEENVEILRGLWKGPYAHDGVYQTFPEIDLVPQPIQDPCPVWVASNPNANLLSESRYQLAIDRVGRLGDGWLTTVAHPRDFGQKWRDIRASAEVNGRDPGSMQSAIHLMVNLAESELVARQRAREFLNTYYMVNLKEETLDAWGAYGTPDQVAARIIEYLDHGLDVPIIRFASYEQEQQLERAMDELIPQLPGPK